MRVQHTLISHLAQLKHAITPQPIDFERLRPYFGWVNKHTIEKTFHKTTQWAVASTRYPMRKHFKSRFPAFNIPRRSEEVATDTIFSDTPAIDSGVTMAQIFVGKRTLVTDVYPLKSQKQFVNTLEDNIRFRGAMTKLISDYAKVEISNKVKDILRMYHIEVIYSLRGQKLMLIMHQTQCQGDQELDFRYIFELCPCILMVEQEANIS